MVEFKTPGQTNTFTGAEAQKFTAMLDRTNRIAASDSTKGQVQWVRLLSGTNEICGFTLVDDGTWIFGSYDFRLRP
jgi:hypothetical protein